MFKRKESKFEQKIEEDFEEIGREIKQVERWIIERRKFFIKLGIVAGFIAILLIISNLYLGV